MGLHVLLRKAEREGPECQAAYQSDSQLNHPISFIELRANFLSNQGVEEGWHVTIPIWTAMNKKMGSCDLGTMCSIAARRVSKAPAFVIMTSIEPQWHIAITGIRQVSAMVWT